MNGWIESRNVGILSGVDEHDVVFRSSSLANKLVIGNASLCTAGLYVENTTVGVRPPPAPGVALGVSGALAVSTDAGDSFRFSDAGLSADCGTEAFLRVAEKGVSASSISTPGPIDAAQVIAGALFRLARTFTGVNVVRVFPSSTSPACDLSGVELSDLEPYSTVRIQGRVLRIVSRDVFSDSIHLAFDPTGFRSLAPGPADLAALDGSLDDRSQFGALSTTLVVLADERVVASTSQSPDGSTLTLTLVQGARSAAFDLAPSTAVAVSIPGVDETTFFAVLSSSDDGTLELVHGDFATPVAEAFPQTCAALLASSMVAVKVVALDVPDRPTRVFAGAAVAYQPSRLLLDFSTAASSTSLSDLSVSSKIEIGWSDSEKSATWTAGAVGDAIAGKMAFRTIRPVGTMRSGVAATVTVTLAGFPCEVVASQFRGSELALELNCLPETPSFSDLVCIVAQPATVVWRVVARSTTLTGQRLSLSIANGSDAARFGSYAAGSTVYALPCGVRVQQRLSGRQGIVLDAPSLETIAMSSQSIRTARLTTPRIFTDGSMTLEAAMLSLDAKEVGIKAGRVVSDAFALRGSGASTFATPLVAGSFVRASALLDLPADALRAYTRYYDADVGMYMVSFPLPASAASFAAGTPLCVDGVMFTVSSDSSFASADAETPYSLPDISQRIRAIVCEPSSTQPTQPTQLTTQQDMQATQATQMTIISTGPGNAATVSCTAGLDKYVNALLGVGPWSLYVLAGCTGVGGQTGVWSIELELVAGDPYPMEAGSSVTFRPLESPAPCVVSETISTLSTEASYGRRSVVIQPSPSTFLVPSSPDAGSASMIVLLSAPSVEARPVTIGVARGGALRLDLGGSTTTATAASAAAGPQTARMILRGAPVSVDSIASLSPESVTATLTLFDRRSLTADSLATFVGSTAFLFDRAWRLVSVTPDESSVLTFSVVLRRLGRAADLSNIGTGTVAFLAPVRAVAPVATAVDSSIVFKGPHYIEVVDGRLVIDSTLSLSPFDDHALCKKHFFVEGAVVAQSVSHVSDRVFKQDIRERSPSADLAALADLNIYDYTFREESGVGRPEFGVLAEEVERAFPGAVNDVDGFVPNVYSPGYFAGGLLAIDGAHAEKIGPGDELELVVGPQQGSVGTKVNATVETVCYEAAGDKTFLSLQRPLENRAYFIYGTRTRYKVVNTTRLLMACINAIKAIKSPA